MAVRLAWTNNSSGHDGTYVYRATSPMDPMNLPAPIADLPAGSEEYVDGEVSSGTHYYRVQDHEGGSVSTASAEISVDLGTDWASVNIGDEVEGGIYAGTISYADAREFHIIAAKAEAEVEGEWWWSSNAITATGATDPDDGWANTTDAIDHIAGEGETAPALEHCRNYTGGGYTDWYMGAQNEFYLVRSALSGHSEFSELVSSMRWSFTSTEDPGSKNDVRILSFYNGSNSWDVKTHSSRRTRPIRRVAV